MKYRNGKKPKHDITDIKHQPVSLIELAVLSRRCETEQDADRIRQWMGARSLPTITSDLACHPSLVKLYERRYGCRAMRQCRTCRNDYAYDGMHLTASGHAIVCIGCHERKQAEPRLKGRALEEQEYTAIPSMVYQSCRVRLSRAQGINGWYRPQLGFGAL
jgi:hypothetical protein